LAESPIKREDCLSSEREAWGRVPRARTVWAPSGAAARVSSAAPGFQSKVAAGPGRHPPPTAFTSSLFWPTAITSGASARTVWAPNAKR